MHAPARFTRLTLYDVLNIDKTATKEQVKKGYRRQALKFHPDHNHSPEANEEFAYLAHAHEVLSDDAARALYDETGEHDARAGGGVGEASDGEGYWRSVFPRVTKEDIDAFRVKYVGSEEEVEDIKSAYERYSGNVQHVLESVPFADADNVARICQILNQHCRAKLSQAQISKLIKRTRQSEAEEAAELAELQRTGTKEEKALLQQDGGGDLQALVSILGKRKEDREKEQKEWLRGMEEKYGGKGKGKGKGGSSTGGAAEDEEPPQDVFDAIQQRMLHNQAAARERREQQSGKVEATKARTSRPSASHSTDSPKRKRKARA